MDRDGYISNGELFLVLKMMVGNNLKVRTCHPFRKRLLSLAFLQDSQLQQIVDKTIMEADMDGDGKLSFEEFTAVVAKTVRFLPPPTFLGLLLTASLYQDIAKQMTLEHLF